MWGGLFALQRARSTRSTQPPSLPAPEPSLRANNKQFLRKLFVTEAFYLLALYFFAVRARFACPAPAAAALATALALEQRLLALPQDFLFFSKLLSEEGIPRCTLHSLFERTKSLCDERALLLFFT